MAIIKITELPAADSPVSASDVAPVVQNGVTKKAAINQFGYLAADSNATTRTIQAKLRETVSIVDFGAVSGGVADCSTAIKNALESGAQYVYVPPGTYAMLSDISAVITTDVTFYGHGTFIYTGASSNTNPLLSIETGNNSLTVDGLSFEGDDKSVGALRIENTATPSSNTLPNCTVSNCFFIRFRMNVASIWNNAVLVRGSYQLVTIANNRVRLITRAAGTGTPGSNGTSGITVAQYSTSQYVRECMHYGNQYAAIFGDDAVNSSFNVDYDAFRFFGPDPTTISGQYVDATLTSYGNVFRNCRGRALKIQAVGSVRDETIVRDSDYTAFGGSTEINFQYGVGMVSNCQFFYRPYAGGSTSPIQTGLALVSFYQGADYSEDTASAMVNGLQVFNSISSGVTTGTDVISQIVGALVGAVGIGVPTKPLISVSNVSVNKGPVEWIAVIGFAAGAYGTLRLDNVVVPSLVYSAVGTNGTDTNYDIVATNVVNIDGVATPANAKPFVTSTLGAATVYGGLMLGGLNQGFTNSYNRGSDTNRSPMLCNSALAGENEGGAVSVQSGFLADDASTAFAQRFYNPSRGLFIVSVDEDATTQGVFATGGNAIYTVAATASPANLFEVSTAGTNPDVDGKFNMWYTSGQLNVKNRLGAGRTVTVAFIG